MVVIDRAASARECFSLGSTYGWMFTAACSLGALANGQRVPRVALALQPISIHSPPDALSQPDPVQGTPFSTLCLSHGCTSLSAALMWATLSVVTLVRAQQRSSSCGADVARLRTASRQLPRKGPSYNVSPPGMST